MKRKLFSHTAHKCPFGCRYCFTHFKQYQKGNMPNENNPHKSAKLDTVLYPACDYDIFAISNPINLIESINIAETSISISTKAYLSDNLIEELSDYNKKLGENGHLIKISVSLSSESLLSQYEPNAASFEQRLENVQRLEQANIKTGLMLKPLLAEVSIKEYYDIIETFKDHVSGIVSGHLYLNESKEKAAKRKVNWLPNKPVWPYQDMTHYIHNIETYCSENDIDYFHSDIELMKFIVNESN